MMRSHLMTIAAVVALTGCTDNPNANFTGPDGGPVPPPPPPPTATIAGRISVSGIDGDRIVELTDANDNVYRLVGNQSSALASVDGADVVARGTFDANPGFVVDEFQVTGMYGRPALDGVLVETEFGFGLFLLDGSTREVPGLSAECAQYLGARLWVIGWDDDSETAFGVIAAI